jgi:hypothetical protein
MLHQYSDHVVIDGSFTVSMYHVKLLEPTFPHLPEGSTSRIYVPGQFHVLAGPGVATVNDKLSWPIGDRVISRKDEFRKLQEQYEDEEFRRKKQVEEEKFNKLSYKEKRRLSYPPIEEMVVALWEHVFENPSAAQAFQEKRLEVKKKYPKLRQQQDS